MADLHMQRRYVSDNTRNPRGDRTMMREEAIFVITDLLAYRSPLRVDIFHLADDTFECRLVVDPDIAFEAMQRALHSDGTAGGPDGS